MLCVEILFQWLPPCASDAPRTSFHNVTHSSLAVVKCIFETVSCEYRRSVRPDDKTVLLFGSSALRDAVVLPRLKSEAVPYGIDLRISWKPLDYSPIEMLSLTGRTEALKTKLVIWMMHSNALHFSSGRPMKSHLFFSARVFRFLGFSAAWRYRRELLAGCLARFFVPYRLHLRLLFQLLLRWSYPLANFAQVWPPNSMRDVGVNHEARALNVRAFERFAEILRRQGVRLIVMDPPYSGEAHWFHDQALYRRHNAFMRSASRRMGFTYVDFSDYPEFEEKHFDDAYHLTPAGRSRFMRLFFIPWLKKEISKTP